MNQLEKPHDVHVWWTMSTHLAGIEYLKKILNLNYSNQFIKFVQYVVERKKSIYNSIKNTDNIEIKI